MKAGYGKCRYCGRNYKLNAAGKIRNHRQKGADLPCGGGGAWPV